MGTGKQGGSMRALACVLACLLLTSCASSVRPWTRTEKVLLAASCTASVYNMYETDAGLDRGCEEGNQFLQGGNPVIGMAIIQLLTVGVVHIIPSWRVPVLSAKTMINTSLAIHDHNEGR